MTPENQAFLDKLAKDGRVGPDEEAARFPMAVGPLREDKDHLGEPASVCDIIMNPTIIRQAHDFRHASRLLGHLPVCRIDAAAVCRLAGQHHSGQRSFCHIPATPICISTVGSWSDGALRSGVDAYIGGPGGIPVWL